MNNPKPKSTINSKTPTLTQGNSKSQIAQQKGNQKDFAKSLNNLKEANQPTAHKQPSQIQEPNKHQNQTTQKNSNQVPQKVNPPSNNKSIIPKQSFQNNQKQQMEIEKQQKQSNIDQEQKQKETQQMKIIDKQQQQEVQYYVYSDLKNFLGILTDVVETLKFFDGSQDAAYVPIAINRLVLQSNLSNGIHFDCQHNFQSDQQNVLYTKEKQNAQIILNEFLDSMQIPKNEKINECIQRYQQTLERNIEMRTIEPLKVEHKAQFNQQVLQKVIGGMQEVDKQLQDVNKGIYQKPEKEDIYKNLNERKLIAQQKLAQQYPQVAHQNKQKINQNQQKLFNEIK